MGSEVFVNTRYFDRPDEAKWYLAGAHAACYYMARKGTRYMFRAKRKDIVELIKKELGSQHKITHPNRGRGDSYWLEIGGGVETIAEVLETKYGVSRQKKGRTFPAIRDKKYEAHFIRGFLDAGAHIAVRDGRNHMNIDFEQPFLEGLHAKLVEVAGVERSGPKKGTIGYSHNDAIRIYQVVYADTELIERRGIYLPAKKELFRPEKVADGTQTRKQTRAKQRLETGKAALRQGKSTKEAARIAGYTPGALTRAFLREGTPIREWLKTEKGAPS